MSKVKQLTKQLLVSIIIPLFLLSLLAWAETPSVAYAQTASISGTVYNDVAGTAISGTFTTIATPAKLSLFRSNGTLVMTTTTDANGQFTFGGLGVIGDYFVTVDNTDQLAGFTDSQGIGMVDQTYASSGNAPGTTSGPICAGSGTTDYTQQTGTFSVWTVNAQNKTKSGPCYGGRAASVVNSAAATLNLKKHIIKVHLNTTTDTITGLVFAFSSNVVTHLGGSGAGSLPMFIRSANAISGPNTMRFVPVVTTNMTGGSNKWWRMVFTTTVPLMPTITGDDTTIDGRAYYYRNNTIDNHNSGNVANATTAGVNSQALDAFERPELEILENLGANEATLTVQGNNVTIRRLAFSTDSNEPGSYHIRQTAGTGLLVEDTIMGYDMVNNTTAATRSHYGIQSAFATNAASTGSYRHNYIRSNLTSLLLSDGEADPGNVAAANLGDWTIEKNILSGGIRLGAGTERILIRYNKSEEALVMAQSANINTAVGNNTITENNFTSPTGNILRLFEADNNTITLNFLQGSTGSAVAMTAGGDGNRISRNVFGTNAGNAIDLGDDGVSTGTGCTDAAPANGGLGRPVITGAQFIGQQLTLNMTFCDTGAFDLELYKASEGAGENVPPAGEGVTYLGTVSNVSGGVAAGAVITVPVNAGLAVGDKLTALAIDTANGNTSEFSANYALLLSIAGKVYNDELGVASPTGPAFVGSTTTDVHLYNIGGTHLASTHLDANGEFVFSGLTNNTYYVTVNEYRGLATGSVGDGTLLVEQTYGSAGNGATGSGPICIGAAPGYGEQTSSSASSWVAGAQNSVKAAGPCFGGRSRASSVVSALVAPAVGASDHAIRVVVNGANVSGVAFGFSANVVTDLDTTATQGSLPTFIKLANTLAGPNAMRFVPTLPTNQLSGANQWWRLSLPAALPALTDNDTTLSGVAYSNTDGVTVRNTNNLTLGNTGVVGLGNDGRATTSDESALPGVPAPELELIPGAGITIAYGLDINANNVTVERMALYGFGASNTTLPTGATNLGETGNLVIRNGMTGITITQNILGAGANSFSDLGANRTKGSNIIFDGGATAVAIDRNLIGFASDSGILKYAKNAGQLSDLRITNNEIRSNGKAPANNTQGAGIELNATALPGSGQNIVIANNLITDSAAQAIQLTYARGATIANNTITSNGVSAGTVLDERQNIQLPGAQEINIQHNIIMGSTAADGIKLIAGPGGSPTAAMTVRMSQNLFGNNRGQAINLVPDGINPNNGACNEAGQQNMGVDYPVITLAEISGTALKLNGSTCAGVSGTVEVYKVAAGSGQGETNGSDIYGEGGFYLGSFPVSGGLFSNQVITGVINVVAGEYVTTLFIDNNGNTSEFSKNAYVYTPVTLAASPSVIEGRSGRITATLDIVSLNPVNVTLVYTNVTASSGDYSAQTTLTIPANTLRASIPFNVVDDTTVEEDEVVQVNIASVQNATNHAAMQSITLLDNDFTSVTLAASPTLVEGTSGFITATLATTSVRNIDLTLVYTNVTTANDDYSAAATLVVPAGQRKAAIPFSALVDNLVEITETLKVVIGTAQGANNNSTPQTITILNDTDHDLIADGKDSDDDGDGILDVTEGNGARQTDTDGIADSLDTDSDNDNIPDAIEGHDANGDGQPDRAFAHQDSDHDGLDDAFDTSVGGVAPILPDTDLDSKPNYLDRDDDNDGKDTDVEDANSDSDNNPATNQTDADNDRIADYLDPDDGTRDGSGGDSDGDGLKDSKEFDITQDGIGPDNTDGDNRPDYLDADDDNDGVPTAAEQADPNADGDPADARDLDSDGVVNYRDNDDDNDGTLTKAEDANSDNDGNPATTPTDADGDAIPDYLDPDDNTVGQNGGDSDGDGLRDAFEYDINNDGNKADDSDNDLRPNYLDTDDDNDGLPTIQENSDPDGNGNPADAQNSDNDATPDYLDADSDNDGLYDGAEYDVNHDTFGPDDSDSDGKADYRDIDDDGDGIPTAQEGADRNSDGNPSDALNYDGDALPNYLDKDDDNDGKNTANEDSNSDGDKNPATNPLDADGDTIPDYLDPNDTTVGSGGGDSDTDGLNDATEAGAGSGKAVTVMSANVVMVTALDTDNDGKPDYWDNDDDNDTLPTNQEAADANGDGYATDARDTDRDGTPDYRDNDDDGDGKLTAAELAAGDADGDRIADYLDPNDTTTGSAGGDSDGDGLRDAYEFDANGDNQGADDSDGDKVANYLDTDDDGDGILTKDEKADANSDGNPADAWDTDADGKPDYLDANNTDGLQNDHDGDTVTTGAEDVNHDGNIYNDDTDGDKIANYLDTDDDGDNVPTSVEAALQDSDSDGTPNYLDNDDDNDGILTRDEDTNHDGNPTNDDADKDGTPNYLDKDSIADFDNDGLPNNVDPDDDNDTVSDVDEGNGTIDTDGDGAADWQDTDDDNDGVDTKTEKAQGDTDGDGTPNYRDRDDDGDGINTTDEDRNGDKNPTNDDTDNDGIANYLDNDDDGDGILTKQDNTGLDPADVNLNDDDTDGDGVPNYLDSDDDGDNVPTKREDLNNDGNWTNDDTDGDGKANALDSDDDGDGIPTKAEDANGNGDPTDDDVNANGTPDYLENASSGGFRSLLPIIRKG